MKGEPFRGSTELMLLSVLADGEKYGYLIQQRLHEASSGSVRVQAGTLYPLLHKLEDEKLVKCRWEERGGRARKWYSLTERGKRRLQHRAAAWHEMASVLNQLLLPVLKPKSV